MRPKFSDPFTNLAILGQIWADFDQHWLDFAKLGPIVASILPRSTESERTLGLLATMFGPFLTQIGQMGSNLATMDNVEPNPAHIRPC